MGRLFGATEAPNQTTLLVPQTTQFRPCAKIIFRIWKVSTPARESFQKQRLLLHNVLTIIYLNIFLCQHSRNFSSSHHHQGFTFLSPLITFLKFCSLIFFAQFMNRWLCAEFCIKDHGN